MINDGRQWIVTCNGVEVRRHPPLSVAELIADEKKAEQHIRQYVADQIASCHQIIDEMMDSFG